MRPARRLLVPLSLLVVLAGLVWSVSAQPPRPGTSANGPGRTGPGRDGPGKPERVLPTDPKLLEIHKEFVKKTEKLATEYENAKQPDKAKVCYEEILRLVPDYAVAKQKIAILTEEELKANRKVLEVLANKDWQETHIQVTAGKTIRIQATGSWTFNMSHKVGPGGMEIAKHLRDFNPGALIGIIVPSGPVPTRERGRDRDGDDKGPKPFMVGDKIDYTAPVTGRLMLRMYDSDESDNIGKVAVEITGAFEKIK